MSKRVVDDVEAAERLRLWVREKFGPWITHATAKKAIRKILGEAKS